MGSALTLKNPISQLAKRAGVPSSLVRAFACNIAWDRSWARWNTQREWIGRLRRSEVLRRYRRGESLASIAKRTGCTGENIRSVALRDGLIPRAAERHRLAEQRKCLREQLIAKRRAERTQERAARKQARLARLRVFLAPARKWWQRGHSVKRIAQEYGLHHNAMAWWIFRGRTELEWFPRRQMALARRSN